MDVFESKTYQDFVSSCVNEAKTKGIGKRLAEQLNCHPTYVSQVLKGKAHLSVDQAVIFCQFFNLNTEETEYFLDLLNRDRATTPEAKTFFANRLAKQLVDRTNLRKQFGIADQLTPEQKMFYAESWIPQAIHVYCQLPGKHTVASIANALSIHENKVATVIDALVKYCIVKSKDGCYYSDQDILQFGKDSYVTNRGHVNWRQKTVQHILEQEDPMRVHYSAVCSLSAEAVQAVRELIYKHIQQTRHAIIESNPEEVYLYCLDFYSLLK